MISGNVIYANNTEIDNLSEFDLHKLDVLSALEIGDFTKEDFEIEVNINRGEFVSMIADLVAAKEYAEGDKVWFTDVLADNENFAKISGAAALGIISGYSDGTFRPENPISYDEAVAAVMKALGYRVAAEVKGGWSVGYKSTANQVGLTDGVSVKDQDAISRIEAVELIYNALDCPVFRGVSYGAEVRYEADKEHTVLTEYHNIYKTYGYVNATLISALVEYSPTDSSHIIIGDVRYAVDNNEFVEYLGYYVEAYYKDNGNGDREIVYLTEDEEVEKIVIKADEVNSFNDLTYYYGDKNKKAVINKNHILIVNGKRLTEYEEADFVPENGNITILSQNGSKNDVVIINTFNNFIVQRAQNGGGAIATFTEKYTLRNFKIDMEREDLRFDLYVNGEKYNFEEINYQTSTDNYFADSDYENTPVTEHLTYSFPVIPEGAVASVFSDEYELLNGFVIPSEKARFIRIYISTDYVDGTAESLKEEDNTIVINGTEYKTAVKTAFNQGTQSFRVGANGRFVFDYDGKIYAWLPDIYAEDGYEYGYLINAVLDGGMFTNKVVAKLLKKDGKIVEYNFREKVRLNSKTIESGEKLLESLSRSAAMLDPTFKISQLIKYKLDDENRIMDLQTVMQPVGVPDGVDKNQLNRDMERAQMAHEYNMLHIRGGTEQYPNMARVYSPNIYAVHFVVPPTETFNEEDYWIQDTWRVNFSQQDWLYSGWKMVDVFDCNDFKSPGAVVIYEKLADWNFLQSYIVVDEITREISQLGTEISVLRGYDGWGSVAYYSDESDKFDGLEKGDFIQIFGNKEKIARWKMIMSLKDAKNCDLSTVPTNKNEGVFEVYSKTTSKNMVLQRGKITQDGKREFQRGSYFRSSGGPGAGAKTGALYYGEGDGENAVFSYFYSGIRDSFSDIKTVLEVGNENATRVFVREQPGMTAIIIYDFEEE